MKPVPDPEKLRLDAVMRLIEYNRTQYIREIERFVVVQHSHVEILAAGILRTGLETLNSVRFAILFDYVPRDGGFDYVGCRIWNDNSAERGWVVVEEG